MTLMPFEHTPASEPHRPLDERAEPNPTPTTDTDCAVPDGAVPHGAGPDGTVADGAVSDGGPPTPSEGIVVGFNGREGEAISARKSSRRQPPPSSRYPRAIPQDSKDGLLSLLRIDRHMASCCERLSVLKLVTPVNTAEVRDQYVNTRGTRPKSDPVFHYRHEDLDLDTFKRDLLALPIEHTEVGHIYRKKRDELYNVATMLQARGTAEFRDRSRLLYGTATAQSIEDIKPWLELPADPAQPAAIGATEARRQLLVRMSYAKLNADVRLRAYMSSDAAAGDSSVGIRRAARFSERELNRIYVHECETHILRTRNGERQPFRTLFYYGFPRSSDAAGSYLATEEGLATLHEELAGLLSNDRKRSLAARVLAVYLMDHENMAFGDMFDCLVDQHGMDRDSAYSITERVHRGGGFTKDHIYYAGYREVRKLYETDLESFALLYLGKIGIDWLDFVRSAYADGDGCLFPAKHLPQWFRLRTGARESDLDGDSSPEHLSLPNPNSTALGESA